MQTRLRSLRRILAVQKDLQRLAEYKVAMLQRKETDLQADQERLVTYLDESHALTATYAKTIATRLQNLAAEKQKTGIEKQKQAERVLEQGRRVGQAERRIEAAEEILRRSDERKDLEAMIEAEVRRRQASLR